MKNVTEIIRAIEEGDPSATDSLLPLVYEELRRLARARLRDERSGHTLQATALVHEAYLRLLGDEVPMKWNSRAHFFGAAAEAMRRILIEDARRKKATKRGGEAERFEIDADMAIDSSHEDRLLELNDAIENLGTKDAQKAELVKLKLFAGMSIEEAGEVLGISTATAYRLWNYSRAWLKTELS